MAVQHLRRNPGVRRVLDPEGYRSACDARGILSDEHAAALIGVTRSQVTRVRNRTLQPGNRFLTGAQLVFGDDDFNDAFPIVPINAA